MLRQMERLTGRATVARSADPPTMAFVVPGETVEVRGIQRGVGESAALLRPGDVLTCRARTADWLIMQRTGCDEMAVHRYDAIRVLIEDCDRD